MKKLLSIIFMFTILFVNNPVALAEGTPTPTSAPSANSSAYTDLQNKIKDLENKISDLKGQENTLNNQIGAMDNSIKVTELRIEATQQQILDLSADIDLTAKKINKLAGSLDDLSKVLYNRIIATYETGTVQPLQVMISAQNASDFFYRLNYLRLAQQHDKQLLLEAQQAKDDYSNQKQILEDKKKKVVDLQSQLESYNKQLAADKVNKQQLLSQTQGNEANYQRLLAQTKAQLAAFSNFTVSQGGASLLSGQTQCDDWGCYYNQRDSQWGGNSLNGTGYTLASDGCLVTSMAMVYTHYGHRDVTPQSINSDGGNFSGIPPALLKKSIVANGTHSDRVSAEIDSVLASGNPVIVGISYDGGGWPDHFLVLISGSNGDYKMNDPFTPNGRNISFRDRYPSVKIVEIDRVSI